MLEGRIKLGPHLILAWRERGIRVENWISQVVKPTRWNRPVNLCEAAHPRDVFCPRNVQGHVDRQVDEIRKDRGKILDYTCAPRIIKLLPDTDIKHKLEAPESLETRGRKHFLYLGLRNRRTVPNNSLEFFECNIRIADEIAESVFKRINPECGEVDERAQ